MEEERHNERTGLNVGLKLGDIVGERLGDRVGRSVLEVGSAETVGRTVDGERLGLRVYN